MSGLSGRAACTGLGGTDDARDAEGRSVPTLQPEASLAAIREAGRRMSRRRHA